MKIDAQKDLFDKIAFLLEDCDLTLMEILGVLESIKHSLHRINE